MRESKESFAPVIPPSYLYDQMTAVVRLGYRVLHACIPTNFYMTSPIE